MPNVYLSIGSNIDREKHIRASINALQQIFGSIKLSSVYESDAVGFEGSPFLNLIAVFNTKKTPAEVDAILDTIEKDNGRTATQKKFNSRTLDLDLVLFGDYISDDSTLEIPRGEIMHYAFVLEPLAEVAGALKHPVTKQRYQDLWKAFDKTSVVQKRIPFAWD